MPSGKRRSRRTERVVVDDDGGSASSETLPPAESALSLLLSNLATSTPPRPAVPLDGRRVDERNDDDDGSGDDQVGNRTYVSPCRRASSFTSPGPSAQLPPAQESLPALLAARSLSRSGRSKLAWDVLKFGLSDARGANGFVPRWVYPRDWDRNGGTEGDGANAAGDAVGPRYLPGTRIPSPVLSAPSGRSASNHTASGVAPASYLPYAHADAKGGSGLPPHAPTVVGSGRISAPPFHATYALETFYLSNQTYADLRRLGELFEDLYDWHGFLHEEVLADCPQDFDGAGVSGGAPSCRNIVHPFESAVPLHSPLWRAALRPIIAEMTGKRWAPGFDVPSEVSSAWDFPGWDVYNASLYLLECQSNATVDWEESSSSSQIKDDGGYETHLIRRCPFALLDVTHLAALAKSDADLLSMAHILHDENSRVVVSWERMQVMMGRATRSRGLLASLWNETRGTFLSQTVRFNRMEEEGRFEASGRDVLDVPVAHNFVGLWDGPPTDDVATSAEMRARTAFQMLQSEGAYAFRCEAADYPLRSIGGCGGGVQNDTDATMMAAIVDPALNYLLSRALNRSSMSGLSSWLKSSTLNLFCSLPNVDSSDASLSCPDVAPFANAYSPTDGQPHASDGCDLTSTLSAAAVYSSALPDPPFSYRPAPPISSSGVIVLIGIELVVALAVGVSCAVMSLHLLRRLKRAEDDEGGGEDAFVRMAARTGGVGADLMDDLYGEDGGGSAARSGGGGFMEEIGDRLFASAPPSLDGTGSRGARAAGGSASGSDRFLGLPVTPRLEDSFASREGDGGEPMNWDDSAGDGSSRIGKLGAGGFASFLSPGTYGWFRRRHNSDGGAGAGEPLLGN